MEVPRFDQVAFTALICVVAYLESAMASQDSSLELKPHFLCMKRLREYFLESQVVLPDTMIQEEASEQGELVATSIEATSTTGQGYSDNGIILQDSYDTTFHFNIPNHNSNSIPRVELWLFPDKSRVTENRIVEVNLVSYVDIETQNNKKHSIPTRFLWDTTDDCAAVDLTELSKKIYKHLDRRNLNDTNVNVELEIGSVIPRSTIEMTPKRALDRELCNAMAQRRTNESFLIVKNYIEEPVSGVVAESRRRRRRQSSEVDEPQAIIPPTSAPTGTPRTCELVPLMVNLTELYGSFLKEPKVTDIKDCSGKCALTLNERVFSKHAEVKERLKLLPGREYLSSFEPLCTPIKFKPLLLLIALQEKSTVIAQMSDLVADKCSCQ